MSTTDNFEQILIMGINADETVIFGGAGISRNSGLPVVNELVPAILRKLETPEVEIRKIMESNLPFEAFMEILRENSKWDKLIDIFAQGEPNTTHIMLAKLIKVRKIKTMVVTSNFDMLIEKALKQEGMAGTDYDVICKEEDFDKIDWSADRIRIIHIHGNIEHRENMAITLKQVASHVLSAPRMTIIDKLFSTGKHKNVLILGYSSSDAFDLIPQIEAISSNRKQVYYVDHLNKEDSHKKDVQDIRVKKSKNPFKQFKDGKRLCYNTDELVKKIWNSTLDSVYEEKTSQNDAWKMYVDDWYLDSLKEYTGSFKYNILGSIFLKISEFRIAIKFFDQALEIAKAIGDKQGEGKFLGNLGLVYSNLDPVNSFFRAEDYYQQGLEIAKAIGDKAEEMKILHNFGRFYASGASQKAIEYLKHGLEIAKAIGDKAEEGEILSSLGYVYDQLAVFKGGDYQVAIKYYEQGLETAKAIGNKAGESRILGSLGNLYNNLSVHNKVDEYQKAIAYLKQGFKLAKAIGDKAEEGAIVDELGTVYFNVCEYQKAVESIKQSLAIIESIEVTDSRLLPFRIFLFLVRITGFFNTLGLGYKWIMKTGRAINIYIRALFNMNMIFKGVSLTPDLDEVKAKFMSLGERLIEAGNANKWDEVNKTANEIVDYARTLKFKGNQVLKLFALTLSVKMSEIYDLDLPNRFATLCLSNENIKSFADIQNEQFQSIIANDVFGAIIKLIDSIKGQTYDELKSKGYIKDKVLDIDKILM